MAYFARKSADRISCENYLSRIYGSSKTDSSRRDAIECIAARSIESGKALLASDRRSHRR